MFFDELDKISSTRAGEEVVNTLIHITDHSQNHKFQDRYFGDIDLDLSKCLIVFSYNDESLVNPVLRDRMVRINIDGYKMNEKVKIAKGFLIPKALKEYAFQDNDIIIDDATIKYLIESVEEEHGVRNLKRGVEEIVSQLNLHRLLKKEILPNQHIVLPFTVTNALIDKYVKIAPVKTDVLNMMYL